MKFSWIKRFLDDNFHPWKILSTWLFARLGGSSIFHYNLQLGERCSIIVKTFPGFYQELIELWCKISYQEPYDIIQSIINVYGTIVLYLHKVSQFSIYLS